MPCPECIDNYERARRAEAIERSLLLFTDTFSKLSRDLYQLEAEVDRRRLEEDPPPPGAHPIKKRRLVLVPAEYVISRPELERAAEPCRDGNQRTNFGR
jgi:hypothetical protein